MALAWSQGLTAGAAVEQCVAVPTLLLLVAFLNSANNSKIIEVICFILRMIIVCNRNATLHLNDKVMLLIEPS